MCGIFCITSKTRNDAPSRVVEGLKSLEYRGYDSWGIAGVNGDGQIFVEKDVGRIGNVTVSTCGRIAIGHTRWATHGGVTKMNAHPHLSSDLRYAIVHNGIIENYQELQWETIDNPALLQSETDSEVTAHMLERDSFFQAFAKLKGLNAVVAMDVPQNLLWVAKSGSPIVLGFAEGENYIASDAIALLPYTKDVYYLEDNQGAMVSADGIRVYDIVSGQEIPVQPTRINWDIREEQLDGYDHYLIKEIMQQPTVLRTIAKEAKEEVQSVTERIRHSYGAFFVACGTAEHAAIAGTYLFSRISKFHVNHASGSEFKYLVDFITRGSLVIALSQSGETIDTIESVRIAQNKGASIVSVVNVVGSTLYRLADENILLRAGPEKCVLATKSYLAQLAILLLTAYSLEGKINNALADLSQAADVIEAFLYSDQHEQIKNLAHRLRAKKDLYLVGRGMSYADALEGALKIKEVTYIHAEGFAGGDLKHGSIALIEEGTPVVVFAPADETYPEIISNAKEIEARGGHIIGVSHEAHPVFDEYIEVPSLKYCSNIINTVPMQLLAYYLAVELGRDPDKPRNLAKSVTVK